MNSQSQAQMKPNKLTQAKKDISEYSGAKLDTSSINKQDVGYYHIILVTSRDNKAGTKKMYDVNVAKICPRSYEQDKKALQQQYPIMIILHDPTQKAASEAARAILRDRKAKKNNQGQTSQTLLLLEMQAQLEAQKNELEKLKAEKEEAQSAEKPK